MTVGARRRVRRWLALLQPCTRAHARAHGSARGHAQSRRQARHVHLRTRVGGRDAVSACGARVRSLLFAQTHDLF